jgi:hypothetical protein
MSEVAKKKKKCGVEGKVNVIKETEWKEES